MALSYEKETFGQHHSHGRETGESKDEELLKVRVPRQMRHDVSLSILRRC